jgi:hypothetical protein
LVVRPAHDWAYPRWPRSRRAFAPTPVEGLWRPATAYDAGPGELAQLT